MQIKTKIINALESGPATTQEIALRMGHPPRTTAAYLHLLRHRGMVTATQVRGDGGHLNNVWKLEA